MTVKIEEQLFNLEQKCDECNGPVANTNGQIVCIHCGLVVDQILTQQVTEGATETRVGSIISYDVNMYKHMKLKRIHDKAVTFELEQHTNIVNTIKSICDQLELPKTIVSHSITLFKRLKKKNKKIVTPVIATISLLYSTRKFGYVIKIEQLIEVMQERKHKITAKNIRRGIIELNLRIPANKTSIAESVYSQFFNKFEIEINRKEYQELIQLPLSRSKNPYIWAVSCIYFYCRYILTRKDVSCRELRKLFNCSESVILQHAKKIFHYLTP